MRNRGVWEYPLNLSWPKGFKPTTEQLARAQKSAHSKRARLKVAQALDKKGRGKNVPITLPRIKFLDDE